jgi:hypothetical protein
MRSAPLAIAARVEDALRAVDRSHDVIAGLGAHNARRGMLALRLLDGGRPIAFAGLRVREQRFE